MKIIIMETANFVFHAAGNTEDEAREALRAGIEAHSRTTKADMGWLLACVDEANIINIEPGACLRDYLQIATVATK